MDTGNKILNGLEKLTEHIKGIYDLVPILGNEVVLPLLAETSANIKDGKMKNTTIQSGSANGSVAMSSVGGSMFGIGSTQPQSGETNRIKPTAPLFISSGGVGFK